MLGFIMLFDTDTEALFMIAILARRLRQARIDRGDTQDVFAARIGLSRNAYANMESGKPGTCLDSWLKASCMLGLMDSWNDVLAKPVNLFEMDHPDPAEPLKPSRKRVKRK